MLSVFTVVGQQFQINTGEGDSWKVGVWIGAIFLAAIVAVLILNHFLNRALGLASIIGLLLLIGVTVTLPQVVRLAINPTRTDTQAKDANIPQNAQVTANRATEFTVVWLTKIPVIGGIKYGTSPAPLTEAAVELNPTEKKIDHLVRVTDLTPGTTYYIHIISGGKEFSGPNLNLQVTLPLSQ